MSSYLLSNIAISLYSINPHLCQIPPKGLADEFCYCGSGSDDGSGNTTNILCQDLDHEHALSVGSWLLTPERIVLEAIIGIVICCIMLVWLIHKLRKISNFSTQQQQQRQHHHPKIKHPKGVRIISLLCITIICWYKLSGFQNKIFFLVMPCNIQWVLSILQCYILPDSFTFLQFCILQLRITYLFSVIIAIVTPETEDCTQFGEYEFYWLNHLLLLILPLLYIKNGSTSCFPPKKSSDGHSTTTQEVLVYNAYWWLFSCVVFYIFYFGPVTILSLYSGLNLNFMLHPPHDHFILKGESFRLVATTLLAACYICSRLLCLTMEKKMCMATAATTDDKFKQTKATKHL